MPYEQYYEDGMIVWGNKISNDSNVKPKKNKNRDKGKPTRVKKKGKTIKGH